MENPVHPLASILKRVGVKPSSEYLWNVLPAIGPEVVTRGNIDFRPWFSTFLFDNRSIVYHLVFIRVPVPIPATIPAAPMVGSFKSLIEKVGVLSRRYKHDVVDEAHFFRALLELFPKQADPIFQNFYDRHVKAHPGREEKRPFLFHQAIDRMEKYLRCSAYPFANPKDRIAAIKREFAAGEKIDSRVMSFLQMHRARIEAVDRIARLKITKSAIDRHNAEVPV